MATLRSHGWAIIALASLAMAAPLAAQDPFPHFGTRFKQYPGNPLLTLESINPWGLPKPGEPATSIPGTVHPDVLYFPQGMGGYKFWMIFTPYDGFLGGPYSCNAGSPPEECTPPGWASLIRYWERLTLARSNDGITWTKDGITVNPVITPQPNCVGVAEWDAGVHYDPDVVYAPGRGPNGESWFLYFAVQNECGGPSSIGLALSHDGLNYEKYGPVIPRSFATPTVVYDAAGNSGQGLFHMWYLYNWDPQHSQYGRFGYATSPDGIAWTPAQTPGSGCEGCWENGALVPDEAFCEGGVTHPDVIKKGNEFWMYYQATPPGWGYHNMMIRRATSTDGVTWTKDTRPILEKYESPLLPCTTTNEVPQLWTFWDRTGPAAAPAEVTMFYRPSAVVVGNAMYLYFGGLDKTHPTDFQNDRDIGLAFSTRFDDVLPTHWAYEAIEEVVKAGIAGGCGNDNFCPDRVAVRQEAASFVFGGARLEPWPDPQDVFFCDITQPFSPEINALYNAGMVEPCGSCDPPDTRLRFCPTDTMNRLDLGLFFYKALSLQGCGVPYFTDVLLPEDKCKIDRLHDPDVHVTAGCGAQMYCPLDMATRATLASFTYEAYLTTLAGGTTSARAQGTRTPPQR